MQVAGCSGWLCAVPSPVSCCRPGRRSGWPLQCGSELGCCCCSLRTALGWALLTNCCPLLIRHTVTPSLEGKRPSTVTSIYTVQMMSSLSSQYKNSFQNTKRAHNTANFLLIKSIYKCVDIYKNEASSNGRIFVCVQNTLHLRHCTQALSTVGRF